MLSVVRLQEDYSPEELRTQAGRRTSVRAVIFCRWLRFEMEWTGRRWRRLAAWIARGCATGFIASTLQDVIDNRTERQQWDGRAPLALEMRSLILFFIRRPSADIRRWPSPDVEPVRWCGIVRTLVQPEMIMPKNEHNEAAEHHERAAKSHRTAAEHHDKGDHDAGHKHSEEAHGHSSKAHERSTHAHGKSGEAKSSKR